MLIQGRMIRLGPKLFDFVPASQRKAVSPGFVFGDGVRGLSERFAAIHKVLWKQDISSLFAHLDEKFKGQETVDIEELRAEVKLASDSHRLGVKLVIVEYYAKTQELPGSEFPPIKIPVLVPNEFEVSLKYSLTLFCNGDEELILHMRQKGEDAALLAREGRNLVPVEQVQLSQEAGTDAVPEGKTHHFEYIKGSKNKLGYAILKPLVIEHIDPSMVEGKKISEGEASAEIEAFNETFDKVIADIEKSEAEIGTNVAMDKIFGSIALVARSLRTKISTIISEQLVDTNGAVKIACDQVDEQLKELEASNVPDEQKVKMRDVIKVSMDILVDILEEHNDPSQSLMGILAQCKEPVILVCRELTPKQAKNLDLNIVKGVVMEGGARTDHAIIVLKARNIPTVYGVGKIPDGIKESGAADVIILDAIEGKVIYRFDSRTYEEYLLAKQNFDRFLMEIEERNRYAVTKTVDGKEVHIFGSADDTEGAAMLVSVGASHGIGLVRSELIYMTEKESEPSVEQLRTHFERLCNAIKEHRDRLGGHDIYAREGRPVNMDVIVRTIDLGEDKTLQWLNIDFKNLAVGRGLALCLEDPTVKEIFKREIKALLLASNNAKNLKIMFPLVNSTEDFLEGKGIVLEMMKELRKEGKQFNENIEIGAMIESRRGVANVEAIVEAADFISIGTNDLTEDMTDAKRHDPTYAIRKRYSEFDPRVIVAIRKIIETCNKFGKPVSLCGDLAGNPLATGLLLGLGLERFTLDPSVINLIKHVIRNIPIKDCKQLVREIAQLKTAKEIKLYIYDFIQRRIYSGEWEALATREDFDKYLSRIIKDDEEVQGVPTNLNSLHLTVPFVLGMHLRQAAMIKGIVDRFPRTKVYITYEEENKIADASDIDSMTTLGAPQGATFLIEAEGPDSEAVIQLLYKHFKDPTNVYI